MQSLKEIEKMRTLSEYINNDFKPIDIKETIEVVQDFFIEIGYSHFPVLENDIFIGCIAAEDVETFEKYNRLLFKNINFALTQADDKSLYTLISKSAIFDGISAWKELELFIIIHLCKIK